MGSERLGAGQHRAMGAGRVQGQGTEGRAGLQDSILRFSISFQGLKTSKSRFCNFLRRKGKGRAGFGFRAFRARAAQGQGQGQGAGQAGRRQGTEGRAGLQDSILRFSGAENLKITFLQLFEKKGEGRAGQGLGSERLGAGQHRARAKARTKGRAGCRAGRATGRVQGGCRGRAQRAGQGYKIPF